MKTTTTTTSENESIIKDAFVNISKDPIVKVVIIIGGALVLLYRRNCISNCSGHHISV